MRYYHIDTRDRWQTELQQEYGVGSVGHRMYGFYWSVRTLSWTFQDGSYISEGALDKYIMDNFWPHIHDYPDFWNWFIAFAKRKRRLK